MSKVPLDEQIEAIEGVIMDGAWDAERNLALAEALRTLKLFRRFQEPARNFFERCLSEVAKANGDQAAAMLMEAFPLGRVTLTIRE